MIWARINKVWRIFTTGLSFFLFGVGGLIIPLIVVPLLYLFSGGKLQREKNGQLFIHYSFKLFIWIMKILGVLTYHVGHIDKLKNAKLILANHPSLLDIVFLISIVPNATCVVKGKLLKNPFMLGAIKVAGYIVNSDDPDAVIKGAAKAFDNGQALIVFPEGTRTTPLTTLKFKRGAANVAVRTQADITPILMSCKPTTLTKGESWYNVPEKKMHFEITVENRIAITPYLADDNVIKAVRNLNRDLCHYFNEAIEKNE